MRQTTAHSFSAQYKQSQLWTSSTKDWWEKTTANAFFKCRLKKKPRTFAQHRFLLLCWTLQMSSIVGQRFTVTVKRLRQQQHFLCRSKRGCAHCILQRIHCWGRFPLLFCKNQGLTGCLFSLVNNTLQWLTHPNTVVVSFLCKGVNSALEQLQPPHHNTWWNYSFSTKPFAELTVMQTNDK